MLKGMLIYFLFQENITIYHYIQYIRVYVLMTYGYY